MPREKSRGIRYSSLHQYASVTLPLQEVPRFLRKPVADNRKQAANMIERFPSPETPTAELLHPNAVMSNVESTYFRDNDDSPPLR